MLLSSPLLSPALDAVLTTGASPLWTFPADSVPDGAVFAPHHFTYPLIVAYIATDWLSDNHPDREPKFVDIGLGLALFSFLFVWPYYHVLGALGSLAGLSSISVGLAFNDLWVDYGRRWRILLAGVVLMAADDWLSHSLGIWTPLDWLFNEAILPVLL